MKWYKKKKSKNVKRKIEDYIDRGIKSQEVLKWLCFVEQGPRCGPRSKAQQYGGEHTFL